MQYKELAPGVRVYENAIEKHNHSILINHIETSIDAGHESWKVGSTKNYETGEDFTDNSVRDVVSFNVGYYSDIESVKPDNFLDSLSILFHNSFSKFEEDYKRDYQVVTEWHDEYYVLRYSGGQQFKEHIDDNPIFPRTISYAYYLNEDYSGGEIEFPLLGISYKPKSNEILFFPSNYIYKHRVNPVIDGKRYAVVSWLN